jgi:hypothetical protein
VTPPESLEFVCWNEDQPTLADVADLSPGDSPSDFRDRYSVYCRSLSNSEAAIELLP